VAEPFTGVLVGFAHELRHAGITVGTGDVLTYFAAVATLDPSDLADLYWAGRAALVSRHEDIPVYDAVFRRYFLGEDAPEETRLLLRAETATEAEAALAVPAVDPGGSRADEEKPALGWMASDVDALKHRSFAACTPEELTALRRIMARMRLTPPRRRSRRTRSTSHPRPPRSRTYLDMRRMTRESLRMLGDPAELYFRQRKTKPRPLILILDVSGSMAEYSRHLLQFAHTARHAAARVEVFCFGTRLTRITRELSRRRPDDALEQAAQTVSDWDGGTRIGACLDTFVKRHARAGLARGAVVVICSDGLDRGDPEILATAMERLHRLCYRIVWLNPHSSNNALGMIAAAPHVDRLLSGHDLATLEELSIVLPRL